MLPNTDLRKIMRGEPMDVPVEESSAADRAIDRVIFVASIKKDMTDVMQKVFWAVNGCDGDGEPRECATLSNLNDVKDRDVI